MPSSRVKSPSPPSAVYRRERVARLSGRDELHRKPTANAATELQDDMSARGRTPPREMLTGRDTALQNPGEGALKKARAQVSHGDSGDAVAFT